MTALKKPEATRAKSPLLVLSGAVVILLVGVQIESLQRQADTGGAPIGIPLPHYVAVLVASLVCMYGYIGTFVPIVEADLVKEEWDSCHVRPNFMLFSHSRSRQFSPAPHVPIH